MNRVNVIESSRVVSFPVEDEALPRIVAACSADPVSLNQFLVAAEAYQNGVVRLVVDGLISFDRWSASTGPESVRETIAQRGPNSDLVFEMAGSGVPTSGPESALTIDLAGKTIDASPGLALEPAGEVLIHDGTAATERAVTYQLPSSWTLRST